MATRYYWEYTRDGVAYRYVRFRGASGTGRSVRLRAEPGTPEFQAEYEAAIDVVGARHRLDRQQAAPPQDHNAGRWLEVREVLSRPYNLGWHAFVPGWYVVRTCPCHDGQPMTIRPYATREAAEEGRRKLLKTAMVLGVW